MKPAITLHLTRAEAIALQWLLKHNDTHWHPRRLIKELSRSIREEGKPAQETEITQ